MGCHIALLLFAGSIAFATGGEERLVFLPEAAGQLSRVGLSPSLRSVDVELMVAQQEARRLNDEGVMMMSSLQYDRAEHLLRRAIDIHPSYPPALCNFGRLLARMGRDMQAASEMMRKAHLLLPSNAEISSAYARLLDEELSDFRAASKVYEEALSMQPSHHHLLHNFAEMLRGRQIDDSRAQELYKQVLKARPDFSASSIGLSLLLLRSGKLNEALQVLQEALVLDPKSVSLLNQQGLVLFEAHQMNEADRTFRSVRS
ncbi:hypothetical protein GUITHDRAFT_117773 [Guillardia theta CCMP2712]|uniref:Uncharacterized protein n=1 Tax=Guillardia theta (strain CCMP2712) TaxID=905079 RepID=L1IIL7_GUITC|nr:hypothetical protein GUITHDRAFT_117773 [Guillardia theta CCMP2712]EKX36103.1 hypothetical protein GUITHDRAFT_117773 [Guillardia theta CCMP2712]|eukprot:XP_005823083.1 hypothetical protein GUITHDRAFT_117773 [Guillardia theta CCMP2712]